MSDSVWYYARGEQEKGPITTVQIKALAAAGKLQTEDFVWKEGMDNWVPAGEVPGLFAKQEGSVSGSDSNFATKQGQPQPVPAPRQPVSSGLHDQARLISRVVFVIGLLMALMARGCDSLGERNVARRKAIAENDRREFQNTWERKRADLQAEQERLEEKSNRSDIETTRLQELDAEITKLAAEHREKEKELAASDWLVRDHVASTAAANDQIWGYWRQVTMFVAALLFTLGVVGVAYTSDGPERWISFILLVVIVYSLLMSNSVWSRVFS